MYSSAFDCLLAGLCKSYSTDFHKVWWKYGTWAKEETFRFFSCNPDHVTPGLGLRGVWRIILRDTESSVCWVKRHVATLGLFYLHDVCSTITIVWHHSALALLLLLVIILVRPFVAANNKICVLQMCSPKIKCAGYAIHDVCSTITSLGSVTLVELCALLTAILVLYYSSLYCIIQCHHHCHCHKECI